MSTTIQNHRPHLAAVAYYGLTFLPMALSAALLLVLEQAMNVALPVLAAFLVLVLLRQMNTFVVSALYHRGASHGSVEFSPVFGRFLRVWGWFFLGTGTRSWAILHRWHHAEADTEHDPHSPSKPGGSFWNIGKQSLSNFWRVVHRPETLEKYSKGLYNDRLERFFRSEERRLFGVLGLRVPLLVGGLTAIWWWVAPLTWPEALLCAAVTLPGLAGAVMSSTIYVINGLAHLVGYRTVETRDTATNLVRRDFLGFGEALHHNHHVRPGIANMAARDDEWDGGYVLLCWMQRVGLVRELR